MADMEINATMDQIEEFKNSILWNDIVRELEIWKHSFVDEMRAIVDNAADSNPSSASILLHMGDLNGRQKAVDYMLSIPDIFLDVLKSRKKLEKTIQKPNELGG